MPTADLVPLAAIDSFTAPIRAILQQFWITSAEEYLSVLTMPNAQDQTNEAALQRLLGLDQASMDTLYQAAKAAAPGLAFDISDDTWEPLGGCLFDPQDLAIGISYTAGEPPPDTLLARGVWPAGDQGQRNTCVAFTAAAMFQLLAGGAPDRSAQFLFWAGKQFDDPNDGSGMRPAAVFQALAQHGACAEALWPYNPLRVYRQSQPRSEDVPQGPPPQAALDDARQHRIAGHQRLNPRDVSAICEVVHQGHAVLIGLPFHHYWTRGVHGRLGRIRPPINAGEPLLGGHAMAVVGFRADPQAPGGGYLVVRNSWGLQCGPENADGPGYCHIPYALISEHNLAAYYITAAAQSSPPPSAGARLAAAPDAAGAAADDLAAARALLARIQSEVAELSRLLARIGEGAHE